MDTNFDCVCSFDFFINVFVIVKNQCTLDTAVATSALQKGHTQRVLIRPKIYFDFNGPLLSDQLIHNS
jgi:hypothetical protein